MKALEGLKILDFTTLLPGPYATLVLADLGAEVLKVSSPSKQDIVLEYEPFVEGTDIAANEAWLGRNKRNIFLNLKHPKAIAIVKQLIQEYDIVIEQFRPGVMEKLGLGYEALKAVNPALIYCSLTGYGQTGPMAKAAGHDCNYLARSGNLAMAGYRDAGPAPMNIQIADICFSFCSLCLSRSVYMLGIKTDAHSDSSKVKADNLCKRLLVILVFHYPSPPFNYYRLR